MKAAAPISIILHPSTLVHKSMGSIRHKRLLAKVSESRFLDFPASVEALQEFRLPTLRVIKKGVLSGPTLEDKPLKLLLKQKDLGIDTIIDFRAEANPNFAKRCKHYGFQYYNLPLDGVQDLRNPRYFSRGLNQKTRANEDFVDMFKNFSALMKRGHAYIGCQYGIDRTNMGLVLDYFLNKGNNKPPKLLTWEHEGIKTVLNRNIRAIKKIYEALSPQQQREIGLSPTYGTTFHQKIKRLLAKNNPSLRGKD